MNKNLKYYLGLPYKIILEFEPEDNTWVAYCPELGRGTCYAIGETREEALNLLEETKKDILQYALDEGKEIPEPRFEEEILPSGQFVVRLPRTLHKRLKDEADSEETSLNLYVTNALAEHLGKKKVYNELQNLIHNSLRTSFTQYLNWNKFCHNVQGITWNIDTNKVKTLEESNLISHLLGDPDAEIPERKRAAYFYIP